VTPAEEVALLADLDEVVDLWRELKVLDVELEKTCTAAPGRSHTRCPVKSAALIAGPGAPSEAGSNALSGSRQICRAQALPGNHNHRATNWSGICARAAHRQTARVATHVDSAWETSHVAMHVHSALSRQC
jgi:hypothetical protein